MVAWLVVAVALTALTSIIRDGATALDDPDPARQRPGLVVEAASAPLAPTFLRRALPAGGAVFFERGGRAAELCEVVAEGAFRSRAVVVTAGATHGACTGLAAVSLPPQDAADAVGLARPRDGGAPVGYVLLDRAGSRPVRDAPRCRRRSPAASGAGPR